MGLIAYPCNVWRMFSLVTARMASLEMMESRLVRRQAVEVTRPGVTTLSYRPPLGVEDEAEIVSWEDIDWPGKKRKDVIARLCSGHSYSNNIYSTYTTAKPTLALTLAHRYTITLEKCALCL